MEGLSGRGRSGGLMRSCAVLTLAIFILFFILPAHGLAQNSADAPPQPKKEKQPEASDASQEAEAQEAEATGNVAEGKDPSKTRKKRKRKPANQKGDVKTASSNAIDGAGNV